MIKINVRKIRKSKGLTLQQLSKLSGVSTMYISEIEREMKMPTIDIICKLAKGLEMKPEDLFNCK